MTACRYARVIVDVPNSRVDRPFDYRVPEELSEEISLGSKVIVPFGARQVEGFVMGMTDESDFPQVKDITACQSDVPRIPEDLVKLASWMSTEYMCFEIDALKTMLPAGGGGGKRLRRFINAVSFEAADLELCQDDGLRSVFECISNLNQPVEWERARECVKKTLEIPDDKFRHSVDELSCIGLVDIGTDLKKLKAKPKMASAVRLQDPEHALECYEAIKKKRPAQAEALAKLVRFYEEKLDGRYDELVAVGRLESELEISYTTVRSMVKSGLLEEGRVQVKRDPLDGFDVDEVERPVLTDEQRTCVDRIIEGMDARGDRTVFLLHGVTGSGKTEVYLRALEHAIGQGRQGILLVPDIALTPQMVDTVRARFGSRVAILHSALSQGERFDEWSKARDGSVDVVVGARSAVFAPLSNLGIVILDEEHDASYKQDEAPRYHAREIAMKRAELSGAVVILGSATPSIESYYRSEEKEFTRLSLPKRIDDKKMPTVNVVDMRAELKSGNRSVLSRELQVALDERLKAGEQSILFMNRRGFSTFVLCRECGYVVTCPNCDVSMVYHSSTKQMSCHYCDHVEEVPNKCPKCSGTSIRYFGAGTERIEEEVARLFPEARVRRMDLDTTRKKGSHREILNSFRSGEFDVLVGTQMIAKGLDIPNITLVGVVAADTALNLPDFRAAERTFQLISQVAGRSGRGTKEGLVIVQTYNPEHYSITYARDHDYRGFYDREITLRRERGYPPMCSIARILLSSEGLEGLAKVAGRLADVLRLQGKRAEIEDSEGFEDMETLICGMPKDGEVEVVGPQPAPIPRIAGRHRWHIILKSTDSAQMASLILDAVSSVRQEAKERSITISVIPDPQSIL